MEEKVTAVLALLQGLVGQHKRLLDTIRLEKDGLVNADLKVVQEATLAKEGIIEAIRKSEQERARLTIDIGMMSKRPFKDVTLSQIILDVQGRNIKLADQLRSVQNTLGILITRITEQNQYNKKLVEQSLFHIQKMKTNVLGESSPMSDTYGASGHKNTGGGSSRFISREA